MRILFVNTVASGGSVPTLIGHIASAALARGDVVAIGYGRGEPCSVAGVINMRIGSFASVAGELFASRLFDCHGLASAASTRRFIREAERFAPDIVHLHNIHGYYLHYPTLFAWLRRSGIPVVWTLHDCWAFTGHCAHPDWSGCSKWSSPDGCSGCRGLGCYPKSVMADSSVKNYALKRRLFTSLSQLSIVAVGQWIADAISRSFLADIPCSLIPNGVDVAAFTSASATGTDGQLPVIAGIAGVWNHEKGIDEFVKLRRMIPSDRARIVLAGMGLRQSKLMPKGIETLPWLCGAEALGRFYGGASVYVSPTYGECNNLTKMEALASGVPVVTYRAGGSAEGLEGEDIASTVECGDVDALVSAVERMLARMTSGEGTSLRERCRRHAAEHYNAGRMVSDTLALYDSKVGFRENGR